MKTRFEIRMINAIIPPGGVKSSNMLRIETIIIKGEIILRDFIAVLNPFEIRAKNTERDKSTSRSLMLVERDKIAITPKMKVFVKG